MCAYKKKKKENGKYSAALVETAVWDKMILFFGMSCPVVCDTDAHLSSLPESL